MMALTMKYETDCLNILISNLLMCNCINNVQLMGIYIRNFVNLV